MIPFQHPVYGQCYTPHYIGCAFSGVTPEIYNKYGEKMELFYLRDAASSSPYLIRSNRVQNRYILWDRYNFSLKTHFYTDNCIKEIIKGGGATQRSFAMLCEPRSIYNEMYELLYQDRGLAREFEKIFTHDEKLLDSLPNAHLKSNCAVAYCYTADDQDPLMWSANKFETKNKDISMVVSGKTMTPLHNLRNAIAKYLYGRPNIDIFGNFVGNYIPHKSTALDSYRYHIVVENEMSSYYYTEKIIDCFISMTIPIYIGATRIGDFFNTDGIIILKNNDDIDKILAQCTTEDYISRTEAIKDNYQRSLKYLNPSDSLYEEFFLQNNS